MSKTTPHWLFGVPFDVVSLEDVRALVFAASNCRKQLVFATPNVNFLAQANRNQRFREDILCADLSFVDGMPVVWLGRLLGVPFRERVSGSDLLESLIARPGPRPLRVFLFGGEEGAAEQAVAETNRRGGGLVAAGFHYPGFGSIDDMSAESVIEKINSSNADLLVIAVGAAKGHRWIEANRHRLTVPVIGYLGAAINFVAGRLNRAPEGFRKMGLEWLWRIKEEPALASRYAKDGAFLLGDIFRFAIPELVRRRFRVRRALVVESVKRVDGSVAASVEGRFTADEVVALQELNVAEIRLNRVTQMDTAGVGWLYASQYRLSSALRPALICDSQTNATLKKWRAEYLVRQESR